MALSLFEISKLRTVVFTYVHSDTCPFTSACVEAYSNIVTDCTTADEVENMMVKTWVNSKNGADLLAVAMNNEIIKQGKFYSACLLLSISWFYNMTKLMSEPCNKKVFDCIMTGSKRNQWFKLRLWMYLKSENTDEYMTSDIIRTIQSEFNFISISDWECVSNRQLRRFADATMLYL